MSQRSVVVRLQAQAREAQAKGLRANETGDHLEYQKWFRVWVNLMRRAMSIGLEQ